MKKQFAFLLIAFFSIHIAFAQKKGLAKVNKIQGIEAYFMSEPLRSYEVVFDVGTGIKMTSVVTAGVVNESVADKASQFVNRAYKEAKSENKKIDAVVYSGGKKVVAVKFTEEATEKTKGIGQVKKIDGIEIYLLAEPLLEYEVITEKKGGLKVKSYVTGGLVNNSIEEDIKQFVKKMDAKEVDALIYSAGKSAVGVKFTK
jgi:ribosomal protein L25 (general stress protein Ctc)